MLKVSKPKLMEQVLMLKVNLQLRREIIPMQKEILLKPLVNHHMLKELLQQHQVIIHMLKDIEL